MQVAKVFFDGRAGGSANRDFREFQEDPHETEFGPVQQAGNFRDLDSGATSMSSLFNLRHSVVANPRGRLLDPFGSRASRRAHDRVARMCSPDASLPGRGGHLIHLHLHPRFAEHCPSGRNLVAHSLPARHLLPESLQVPAPISAHRAHGKFGLGRPRSGFRKSACPTT